MVYRLYTEEKADWIGLFYDVQPITIWRSNLAHSSLERLEKKLHLRPRRRDDQIIFNTGWNQCVSFSKEVESGDVPDGLPL